MLFPALPCQRSVIRLPLGALALCLALSGCARTESPGQMLREPGVLKVATTFGPMSYYLGAEDPEGPGYEMVRDFAAKLGARLDMTAYPDVAAMQAALRDGKADIAAASLTFDPSWSPFGQAAQPCYLMPQVFVGVRGRTRAREARDLAGLRLLVTDKSPQFFRAQALRADIPTLKVVPVSASPDKDWPDLLMSGDGDLALVDAAEFALVRNSHVRLIDAFGDTEERPVQWIARQGNTALIAAIDQFCEAADSAALLARAMQRTSIAGQRVHRVAAREFRLLQTTRLPALLPFFQEAAAASGLDWQLIAALGYQESQWNPAAISPNGAQGLMMLMPPTARSLGVVDPLDARASILGGATYLAQQMQRLPARIRDPDRVLFALAVYNIGLGHVEDARLLTQKNGGDANLWADVKRYLPLLEQQYWYSRAANGYARGSETVGLVENVRQYRSLLADYVPPVEPPADEADADSDTDTDSGADALPKTEVAPPAPAAPDSH